MSIFKSIQGDGMSAFKDLKQVFCGRGGCSDQARDDLVFYGIRIVPWDDIPNLLKELHENDYDLTNVLGVIGSNMSDEYRQPSEGDDYAVLYQSALFLASVGYEVEDDPRLNGEYWPDKLLTGIVEAKKLGKIEYERRELAHTTDSVVALVKPNCKERI
jgi:hypothetical protein